ncbi:MAG: hypothetical protein KBF21_05970 [Thermoanaerobaculia bacterium]|jgi:hypothetical protein|nr:hypothetical protein [Thermoanaerobaculia bacterium]MBP9823753.1 hypothetical protein [Thermoanaerobaculia bacterium]
MKSLTSSSLGALAALSACMFAPAPAGAAGTLFLNRCEAGCAYTGGPNDSCANTSAVFTGSRFLAATTYDDADWNSLVACVESVLDPFDVTLTTTEPVCGGGYWEIPVAGTSANLGLPDGLPSVSPFSCAPISNAPAFVFASAMADPLLACWRVLNVFGSLMGADYVHDGRDPMTVNDGCLAPRFSAVPLPCTGIWVPGNCCTGAATQTSQAILFGVLGKRPGGAVFGDGFEAWSSTSQVLSGSTCHWDQALAGLALAGTEADAVPGLALASPSEH